jgi:hypothetical protein
LFPLAQEVTDALDLEGNGAESIDLPVMAIGLPCSGAKPLLFYTNRVRQLVHILKDHGLRAMLGFIRLVQFCKYPAAVMGRFNAGHLPRTMDELLEQAPNDAVREPLDRVFKGSAYAFGSTPLVQSPRFNALLGGGVLEPASFLGRFLARTGRAAAGGCGALLGRVLAFQAEDKHPDAANRNCDTGHKSLRSLGSGEVPTLGSAGSVHEPFSDAFCRDQEKDEASCG